MKAAMKCFGADQDVPGNTGATLPSPGAALGVPLGEAVAPAAAGEPWGRQLVSPRQGEGHRRLVVIYVTGRLQFHLSMQRNIKSCMSFNWALWSCSKERLVELAPEEGGLCAPLGWGSGAPGGCPWLHVTHRMITGSCRTGHRYPQLNKA